MWFASAWFVTAGSCRGCDFCHHDEGDERDDTMRFNSLGQVVPDRPFQPTRRDDGDMPPPPPPADAESRRHQRILLGRVDHLVRGGRCRDADTGEPAASCKAVLSDRQRGCDMMDETAALAAADALEAAGIVKWVWAKLAGHGAVRALRRVKDVKPLDTAAG